MISHAQIFRSAVVACLLLQVDLAMAAEESKIAELKARQTVTTENGSGGAALMEQL